MQTIKAVFKTNPLNAKIKIPLCSQKHSVWCRCENPFSREHSTLMRNDSRGFQETLHSKPRNKFFIQKLLYSYKRLKRVARNYSILCNRIEFLSQRLLDLMTKGEKIFCLEFYMVTKTKPGKKRNPILTRKQKAITKKRPYLSDRKTCSQIRRPCSFESFLLHNETCSNEKTWRQSEDQTFHIVRRHISKRQIRRWCWRWCSWRWRWRWSWGIESPRRFCHFFSRSGSISKERTYNDDNAEGWKQKSTW